MAKNNKTEQPDDSGLPEILRGPEGPVAARLAPPPQVTEIPIKVPVIEIDPDAYRTTHISVGGLTRRQRNGLKRMTRGLQEARETIELHRGPRYVNTDSDAIRWILEQIG